MNATPNRIQPEQLYQTQLFETPDESVNTSKAARRAIEPKVASLQTQILNLVIARGSYGATADEIQADLNISPNTCTPRCLELRRAKLIHRDNRKRPTASGCLAFVYVATVSSEVPND